MSVINEKIEELAKALVMAEPGDVELLEDLHARFNEVHQWAVKAEWPDMAIEARAAARLVDDVLRHKASDPAASLETAGRVVILLQSLVSEGQRPPKSARPKAPGVQTMKDGGDEKPGAPSPIVGDQEPESTGKESEPGDEKAREPEPAAGTVAVPPPSLQIQLKMDVSLMEAFHSEANEHLAAAETHLLTLEANPNDTQALNAVFRAFHTIKGTAAFMDINEIRSLAHEMESLLEQTRKGAMVLRGPPMDLTFEAIDVIKRLVKDLLLPQSGGTPPLPDPKLSELMDRIRKVAGTQDPEAQAEAPRADPVRVLERTPAESAGQRPQPVEPSRQNVARAAEEVKVKAERLDRLLDTIGELVIAESMVSQCEELKKTASPALERQVGQLDKITRTLQEMSTSLRMVPIKPVFDRMARLVRDLARKAGKQLQFVMSGEDTELDKAVVDRIMDPLVHLMRNAVDHGVEDAVARRATGKPETARIELRAFHRAGNIFIEVEDDGRGMDLRTLLAKARELGLASETEAPGEQEILNLIFEPGFSTAAVVTDVSGRGVGMDVVKRTIEAMRGNVLIRSRLGEGTTFTVVLPLTMAIIDGMQIRVGADTYIIPTLSVIEAFRPRQDMVSTVVGKGELVSFRGRILPLFRLSRLFGTVGAVDDPCQAIAVVVEDAGRQTAILADELLGQQRTVIKSLGEGMGKVPGISGASVMADGRPGLTLDIPGLVRLAASGNWQQKSGVGGRSVDSVQNGKTACPAPCGEEQKEEEVENATNER